MFPLQIFLAVNLYIEGNTADLYPILWYFITPLTNLSIQIPESTEL